MVRGEALRLWRGLADRWQGWAVLGLFISALAALGFALPPPGHPVAYACGVMALVAWLTIVAYRHTRGGWRWRSGEND